ncbi:hypothetical protein CDL15_Pgr024048 [Punica granatum]|uniref:Uncharacterized protein n=1 Tax=Punica granatum TaxID=22663 RepID=A0A218XWE9_PUNGR|nr:hypothetical protein CDL15_Pgr024048 [Punica granatum]PKI61698.1 hypothetical protein CRG98_017922 [Punica granatum]
MKPVQGGRSQLQNRDRRKASRERRRGESRTGSVVPSSSSSSNGEKLHEIDRKRERPTVNRARPGLGLGFENLGLVIEAGPYTWSGSLGDYRLLLLLQRHVSDTYGIGS